MMKEMVTLLGRADRPKEIAKTSDRSPKVIPFARDAAYYARKGAYYNYKNKLSRALLYLEKAVEAGPEDALNHYNLACLLSKADRLKDANTVFKHIIKNIDPGMSDCYFFMAINYGLMEDLHEAKLCLLKYLQAAPEGDMAEEAEDILYALEEDGEGEAYNRSLNAAETEAMQELITGLSHVQFKERLLEDRDLQETLQWGLCQGGNLLKEAIIRLYGQCECEAAKARLAEYIANPWVNERLRQLALLELKKMHPGGSYRIFRDGQFYELALRESPPPAPLWDGQWQRVLECTFANMRRSEYYSEEFFDDAEAIWLDYINRLYPQGPRVERPQTWAAGLEYCLSRFHFLGLTQKEVAAAYGVSAASVRRKFGEINRVLQLERKAYHNMMAFLGGREEKQY